MAQAQDHETTISILQPYLDILKDGSTLQRPAKKKAIDKVKQISFQATTDWAMEDQLALYDHLLDPFFLWTTSDIEYIREKAVLLVQSYVSRVDKPSDKAVEACLQRFPLEPTEEIRQTWMDMVLALLKKTTTTKIKPPMDEVWFGLAKLAVKDACPNVTKQGAQLVIDLALIQPIAVSYRGEHTIIHSVLPLLTHKHTAIRVLGIKAMYQVLLCSSQGTTSLPDTFTNLVQDHSASVRTSLYTSIGDLLLNWTPADRYTHAGRVLPVLFAGLTDELDSIRDICRSKLDQIGVVCCQDLVDAGVVDQVDETDQVDMGLKHLVHQCYDQSMKQLLDDSNDFIATRKTTALATFYEYLKYVSSDDLVRTNKKILQGLMMIMATTMDASAQHYIDQVVQIIGHLLSWPILLDQLLPRLSKPNLLAESSKLPSSTTVSTILNILLVLGNNKDQVFTMEPLNDRDRQRIKTTFHYPHLAPYLKPADIAALDALF
ncbi:armadillo-type protein [Chlamydoabsidia padenii]|nr:armadillo-type protein [Chlamydoabsidia padenii]